MKIKVGLIPGIINKELGEDRWGVLEQLARLGYRGIESGVLLQGDVAENRKRAEAMGLRTITLGAKRQALETDLAGVLRDGQALGVDHVSMWFAPCASRDQLLRDAEFYNRVGRAIAEQGMKFCYHNHDHEFKTDFEKKRAINILMEATDPKGVYFELDVAWVVYGGADPVGWLKTHAERIPVIHLKDIADLNNRGTFTAVGTGIVNVRGVLEQALANGMEWAVVEQDRPHRITPMESVTASILNLRDMGLA